MLGLAFIWLLCFALIISLEIEKAEKIGNNIADITGWWAVVAVILCAFAAYLVSPLLLIIWAFKWYANIVRTKSPK